MSGLCSPSATMSGQRSISFRLLGARRSRSSRSRRRRSVSTSSVVIGTTPDPAHATHGSSMKRRSNSRWSNVFRVNARRILPTPRHSGHFFVIVMLLPSLLAKQAVQCAIQSSWGEGRAATTVSLAQPHPKLEIPRRREKGLHLADEIVTDTECIQTGRVRKLPGGVVRYG